MLHFTLQDGGRKVNDKDRLRSIEQRLQQRFCGRQGLNGGVRRLVVERFLRAEAPWKHEVLELAPPPPAEEQVEACSGRDAHTDANMQHTWMQHAVEAWCMARSGGMVHARVRLDARAAEARGCICI